MPRNVTRKLIESHLVDGTPEAAQEIALKIDQTLTQDATGTMVMLELEALRLDRVKTEVSVQYVDHNLLQADFKNADDHRFLRSACRRFGVWYSRPGNGVSHPVHMERFGVPGKTLLGSDSHTCSAGSLGMLAVGAGGLEVALAMAGEPYRLTMPRVMGVRLTGELAEWVSAKDVILEMLRRHSVDGGVGKVIEYYGPGVATLSAMERHVIANMGAEMGATTTVFPADERTREFLRRQGREEIFVELLPDDGAEYDEEDEIDLSGLEPLIACPTSPGNVVPVREVAGRPIGQAYIGSSANPALRDLAVPALMVDGRRVDPDVSFDINPASRQILENLIDLDLLGKLVRAGARLHQAGCGGCIGMGQAPATDTISLRTVPRNFPGRSGTREDQVYLCSPETATASALSGKIPDPRQMDMPYPLFSEPERIRINTEMLVAPEPKDIGRVELAKGPNISSLPEFDPLPENLTGPVLLKVGDDISTDEILPAGAKVLPFRSNIPAISEFVFWQVDPDFAKRAADFKGGGFLIVGGDNYGQGSSREHAAIAPRYLGLRAVLTKGFARIHRQNLVNFGILPLTFVDPADYDAVEAGDELSLTGLWRGLQCQQMTVRNETRGQEFAVRHGLGPREREMVLAGGLINHLRRQHEG